MDFVLVGTGLITEAEDDLEERNLDKNRGNLVVNDLQFYIKN